MVYHIVYIFSCSVLVLLLGLHLTNIKNVNSYKILTISAIQATLLQAGTSTKDSVARGYGLHICKKILDKYGGSIGFKNTTKNTVIFTVRLSKGEENYDTKAI